MYVKVAIPSCCKYPKFWMGDDESFVFVGLMILLKIIGRNELQ